MHVHRPVSIEPGDSHGRCGAASGRGRQTAGQRPGGRRGGGGLGWDVRLRSSGFYQEAQMESAKGAQRNGADMEGAWEEGRVEGLGAGRLRTSLTEDPAGPVTDSDRR